MPAASRPAPLVPKTVQIISLEPKFQGGFSTRVAYKGFDLNVITAFRCGRQAPISTLQIQQRLPEYAGPVVADK